MPTKAVCTMTSERRFRPGMGLTIATLVALAILIGLGSWQIGRIPEKRALLNRIHVGLTTDPMPLPVHVDDPSMLDWRRVSLEGTVADSDPLPVFATNQAGKGGYHLYLPVKTRFGMAVLVNFGWVPMDKLDVPLPRGQEMTISGVFRTSAVPGFMSPENEPEKRIFYTADVHEMAAVFGLRTKEYYHFRVIADPWQEAPLPEAGQARVDIPNNHFEYAMTWFGLALTLVGVYVAYGLRRARKS